MNYFIDIKSNNNTVPKRILNINIPNWLMKSNTKGELISIGLYKVSNNIHTEYYGISKEFNLKLAWENEEIKHSILKPIFWELYAKEDYEQRMFNYKTLKKLINKYGKTNKEILSDINNFIYSDYLEPIENINMLNWRGVYTELEIAINKNPIKIYYYNISNFYILNKLLPGSFINELNYIKLEELFNEKNKKTGYKILNSPDFPIKEYDESSINTVKWMFKLYSFLITI